MKIKLLFSACVIGVIMACGGSGGGSSELGASVFKTHCMLCHGADGKLGLNGAKDLTASVLSLDEKVQVITKGRNTMLAYENTLSPEEIQAVAKHVHSLKK